MTVTRLLRGCLRLAATRVFFLLVVFMAIVV